MVSKGHQEGARTTRVNPPWSFPKVRNRIAILRGPTGRWPGNGCVVWVLWWCWWVGVGVVGAVSEGPCVSYSVRDSQLPDTAIDGFIP